MLLANIPNYQVIYMKTLGLFLSNYEHFLYNEHTIHKREWRIT